MHSVFALCLCLLTVWLAYSQTCESLGVTTREQAIDSQLYWISPNWVAPDSGAYKTVLVRSRMGSLFRSNDTGATWEKLALDGRVRQIIQSPDNKGVILLGTGRDLWVSTNEAKEFKKVVAPGSFISGSFDFHPRHPSWVIAITSGSCQLQRTTNCSNDLYMSQDMGVHWGLIRSYVWSAAWHGLDDNHDQMIIAWERRSKVGNIYNDPVTSDIVRSETYWRDDTNDVVAKDTVGFLVLEKHVFFAQYTQTRSLILKASRDMGETFHTVTFPGGLDEYRYRILDASEGSTYIAVIHSRTGDWANVYASNAFDTEFTLELDHVQCPGGYCDFSPIHGIEGVYLANQFRGIRPDSDTGTFPHTLISYDKGGEWNPLPFPKGAAAPLQLQGPSSDRHVSYYTADEAVGIIFANGNTGESVSLDDADLGVYFSRDAGWTWKFVEEKPHIYEFGNRGALVIMVLNEEDTNAIQFSLDEGSSWINCTFGDAFRVENIVSDPDFGTKHFLMYGNRNNNGIIVSLDFSGIHERECIGYQTPGQANSDYEYWIPSDRDNDECLLGRTSKYIRRKQDAKCFNPVAFKQTAATFVKNCSCTDEDYECDFCFVRSADGKTCVPDTTDSACKAYDPKQEPSPCYGVWYQSQGYRRVPGDSCDNKLGINRDPVEQVCGGKPGPQPQPQPGPGPVPQPEDKGGNHGVVAVLVIVLIIAVAFGVFWYFAGHNAAVRSFAERFVPERFLPEFSESSLAGDYTPVSLVGEEEIEDDAREVDLSDDDKSTSDTPGFNPRA